MKGRLGPGSKREAKPKIARSELVTVYRTSVNSVVAPDNKANARCSWTRFKCMNDKDKARSDRISKQQKIQEPIKSFLRAAMNAVTHSNTTPTKRSGDPVYDLLLMVIPKQAKNENLHEKRS